MAPRALVPRSAVDGWEGRLRTAVEAALAEQLGLVERTLRSHGLSASLTAASSARKAAAAATGAIVVGHVWDQAAWIRSVEANVSPVADEVAQEATAAAADAAAGAMWGAGTSQRQIASTIVSRAIDSGAAIGARADAAGLAGDDVAKGISDSLSSAGDILGDLVSRSAEMAATLASNDVAVAVTALGAPEYLSASKQWVNAGDDKVREAHQDVDDVAINEYFDVGGEPMIGPGDPQASDENTINCRCHVEYDGIVPEGSGYDDPETLPQYAGENA